MFHFFRDAQLKWAVRVWLTPRTWLVIGRWR